MFKNTMSRSFLVYACKVLRRSYCDQLYMYHSSVYCQQSIYRSTTGWSLEVRKGDLGLPSTHVCILAASLVSSFGKKYFCNYLKLKSMSVRVSLNLKLNGMKVCLTKDLFSLIHSSNPVKYHHSINE